MIPRCNMKIVGNSPEHSIYTIHIYMCPYVSTKNSERERKFSWRQWGRDRIFFFSCRTLFSHISTVAYTNTNNYIMKIVYDVILRCYSECLWCHSFNCTIFQGGFLVINHWKLWVISACLRILSINIIIWGWDITKEKKNVYTTTQQEQQQQDNNFMVFCNIKNILVSISWDAIEKHII